MKPGFKRILLAACLLCAGGGALTGCDSKPPQAPAGKTAAEKYTQQKTLQGLVSNDDGPVKAGIVKALTESGRVLAEVGLSDDPRYRMEVPAGTVLPIILAYYPSAEAGEEQRMVAVVVHAAASKFDINQLSTRIARQAKALGGYTHKNLVSAAEGTASVPASNKTTAGFRGDPTTQYGGWH
ncbi:hypothetical protein NP590_18780 [Methylomonas sp. SURF-2]|uniref:Lipoprotein n=1 Tax=Methylomonas subterranea TaxID=2952225 RepID=A0ABT1TL33_9GAMM|nr:hypothetical protein [Methylomonas sp. SURF-2]MCQ8106160.1 hypothetical protein [Methylomonas sp. SURF-2]